MIGEEKKNQWIVFVKQKHHNHLFQATSSLTRRRA